MLASASIFVLAIAYPETYVRIRPWLLLMVRLHRSSVMIFIMPDKRSSNAQFYISQYSRPWFYWCIFLDCAFSFFFSTGYRLVSVYILPMAIFVLLFPFANAFSFCYELPPKDLETTWQAVHAEAADWIDWALNDVLGFPFTIENVASRPWPLSASSCYLVYFWALLTLGFFIPWIISTYIEEQLRSDFIMLHGQFRFRPDIGWNLVHGAAMVLIGSKVTWVAFCLAIPVISL